jgi:hypothetical protein
MIFENHMRVIEGFAFATANRTALDLSGVLSRSVYQHLRTESAMLYYRHKGDVRFLHTGRDQNATQQPSSLSA